MDIVAEDKFTGKKIGNIRVFNYSIRHNKWYVIVEEEGNYRLSRASQKQLENGEVPDEVIRRLVGNPYIHFTNGITLMADLNAVTFYLNTVDFDGVRGITWRGHSDSRRNDGVKYITGGTWTKEKKKWQNENLHGYIFKLRGIGFEQIDHIDRNTLNNTRENLRVATHTENAANRGLFKNNKVGKTGVRQIGNRFAARITVNGKEIHLGCYSSIEEAYEERLRAEKKYFKR